VLRFAPRRQLNPVGFLEVVFAIVVFPEYFREDIGSEVPRRRRKGIYSI
jgi:hypothetical protein